MKKNIYLIIILVILIALITGIILLNKDNKEEFKIDEDKTYTYTKEGFGSDFTITLRKDGTSSFYEGVLSSYLGEGTYQIEDNKLTLITPEFTNYFIVRNDELEFIKDGSSNFPYITVEDKDIFKLNKK